jgi:signal transduction histidine kinase
MRSRSRSLRVKLTLWFLAVFSLIQIALLVGLAVLQREELLEAAEARLFELVRGMVESQIAVDPELEEPDLGRFVPPGGRILAAAVRDERGALLGSWQLPEQHGLPFGSWEVVPSGALGPVLSELPPSAARRYERSGRARVLTLPHRVQGEPRYLQAVVREDWRSSLPGPLFELFLKGLPAGTIAALLAAWIIAGRAVAPIRRLSEAARDLTPQRLSERIQVETQDEEIARLQQELNAALERLEAGFRAQEDFLSNVSHELKTPIAVLLAEAQVLRAGGAGSGGEDFVQRVEEELSGLGLLVDSFLQIARAEIGERLPHQAVSPHDLLLEVLESSAARAHRQSVPLLPELDASLDSRPEARILGDPVLLRTLLDNLVRNAIRHSPPRAPVRLSLALDGAKARFLVRDHGPGIPEEAQQAVFERFVRLSRDGEKGSGTGIGLSIAAHIARLHGGHIALANAEGGGCRFTVELPLSTPS